MIATLKVIVRKLDIKDEIIEEVRIAREKWPDDSCEAPTYIEYVFGEVDLDKDNK